MTSKLQNASVLISWNEPVKRGALPLWYSIECTLNAAKICKKIKYIPPRENITSSSVFLSNLEPYTWYSFMVYSENAIVNISGRAKRASTSVKFQTMPGSKWCIYEKHAVYPMCQWCENVFPLFWKWRCKSNPLEFAWMESIHLENWPGLHLSFFQEHNTCYNVFKWVL